MMHQFAYRMLALGILNAVALPAQGALIASTNLDDLILGAKVVGPVGPEVETSFVNATGEAIGDLNSSVSCPQGFVECVPSNNPAGTLYIYLHEVTPGIDLPNDPPFPAPGTVRPFDGADSFSLNFDAAGFTGVAGYSFSQATRVLAPTSTIAIEQLVDGSLLWDLSTDAGWDTGETLTFFWQTTQAPSGPGGRYALGTAMQGTGAGPLPTPVFTVTEPPTLALCTAAIALAARRRRARTKPRDENPTA